MATGGSSIAPMRPPIDGGTIVVTGASGGIGRELAVQLAARAAILVLIARRAEVLEELRQELTSLYSGLRVVVITTDLSDEAEVERALAELHAQVGEVDVLVNNAGIGDSGLFDRAKWVRTRQLLATNVLAPVRLSLALVPAMVARGRGGVLNVGSGAGLTIMPAAAAYTASKHFIDGFSEALRADLAGTGVVVTQVCPGPVDSGFDQAAGSVGGMTGGPPRFVRISAEECAREALGGFDRGAALVFPGRPFRILMHLLALAPRRLLRRQAALLAARVRATGGAGAQPGRTENGPAENGPAESAQPGSGERSSRL
jgi:uncharacterized protein